MSTATQSLTRTEKWLPAIRKRAEELEIKNYQQLWKRIETLKSRYPDFFGHLSYFEVSLVVQGDTRHIFLTRSNDYRNDAYATALALDTTAEKLFGPVPKQKAGRTLGQDTLTDALRDFDILRQEYSLASCGNPLNICLSQEFNKTLHEQLDIKLDPRQNAMVSSYYGLNDVPKTYDEIARQWDCSTARARQIVQHSLTLLSKNAALKKYRAPA